MSNVFSSGENGRLKRLALGKMSREEIRVSPESIRSQLRAIALLALAAAAVNVQVLAKSPQSQAAPVHAMTGQQTFSARCAGCHGLDGRGSQRAPNIATDPTIRHSSDPELAQTIFNGRTDSGMPAFRELGREEIQSVVDYLRVLQGVGAVSPVGNPQKGKAIFFGTAACASCHTVAGQAVFIGSDLSTYARGLTSAEIRKAIADPAPATGRARTAVAMTRDGQKFSGTVRNEDNFSVQLQGGDGTFHFLLKSDLDRLEYQRLPPMPTDYGQKLSQQELDDLVGYLQSIKAESAFDPGEEQ
jgi:putative heme-binding domain-containing protein